MTDLKTIQAHVGVPADGVLGPQTLKAIASALGISEVNRTMRDPAAFFAALRKITGNLNQVQVDTINGLLAAAAHWPIGWLAYGFATAWHEARLQPVDEIGKGKGLAYAKPGARMKAIANPPPYGGQIPYGRGLVQLTWCDNYEWADAAATEAGLIQKGDILKNFDLVKRPDIATFILVKGMEGGHFTGKGLASYIGPRGTVDQFTQARRIINGTDKAELIAGYAIKFQDAADAGRWG
jgi:hypothetical protein